MQTTPVQLTRLLFIVAAISVTASCCGPKEQPKTPASQKSVGGDDYTEDEVRDSPDWR